MSENEVALFCQSIASALDAAEVARKVKLAFRKMPGETALVCFAQAMTAPLPHPMKVAVWEAVRYSHIWWGVDDVLKGSVMANPVVQKAFADAVPMRAWLVRNQVAGCECLSMTLGPEIAFTQEFAQTPLHRLIYLLVHFLDASAAGQIREFAESKETAASLVDYSDRWGNNLLWYLTYRDDQNARGGFACPCLERELLRLGVNPNHCNDIGLCWADVRRHLIRPEA